MPISPKKPTLSNYQVKRQIRAREKLQLFQRQMSILIKEKPILCGNPQQYQRRLQDISYLKKKLQLLEYQSLSLPKVLVIQDLQNARILNKIKYLQNRLYYQDQIRGKKHGQKEQRKYNYRDVESQEEPKVKPQEEPKVKPQEEPQEEPKKNPNEQSQIKVPDIIEKPQQKNKQQQEEQRITYKQITLLSQSDLKLSDFKKFLAQPVIQFQDQTLIIPKQKPLLALGYAYLQFLAETQNKKLVLTFKDIILKCQFGVYHKKQITEIIQNQNDLKTLIIKILNQILDTKNVYEFLCDYDVETYYQFALECMILQAENRKQYEPLKNQNLLKRFAQCFALTAEADIQAENFRLIGAQNQYISFHQEQKQFIAKINQ